ncbi:MAG: hypothetical protein EOO36_13630, partial [Cytophagaceae bacterium]
MKVFFRRIHLYLGLVSGLFLVIVCLTGSILVFEEELTHALNPERYTVAAATTPRLSLAQLTEAVRASKPKAKINAIKVYADPTRTVEISLAGSGRPGGPQGGGGGEGRGQGMREQGGEGNGGQRGQGEEGRGGRGQADNDRHTGTPEGQNPREQRGEGRGEDMRGEGREGMRGEGRSQEASGPAAMGGPGAKGGRGGKGGGGP